MNIIKHQKKIYDAENKKENKEDNVSRHKHRKKHNLDKTNKNESPSNQPNQQSNGGVKKGDDRNAFMIKKQITGIAENLIIPNINAVTLDYLNNNSILELSRQSSYVLEKQKDLVSVIIPTFNRYESLKKAIESIKNQTYKNVEIIVVNDASTQKEYTTEQFDDDIQIIHLPVNMKTKYNVMSAQGLTRNEGIKIARGKWIAFLDDDDYWVPEKLQIQLHLLHKYKMKVCSTNYFRGHGIFKWDHKLKYNKGLYFDPEIIHKLDKYSGILKAPNFKYSLCSTVLIEKKFLEEMGMFKLIDAEDWDLWDRIYKIEKTLFIDINLIYYDLGHAGGKHYKVGMNWAGKEINETE